MQDIQNVAFKKANSIFFLTTVNGKINWEARKPNNGLVSDGGKDLEIKKDGYYLLNLQVTLKTSKCPCNETRGLECMISVTHKEVVILQGWINKNTCSTGLLGKVVELHKGRTLEFTVDMPSNQIAESESLTHLDIIMLSP